MRLIGMGLLAFLLAGIALFLSRSEALQLGKRTLVEAFHGPQLRFETAHRPPQGASGRSHVIAQRINPDEPIILSGLPAYQGATFFLPTDARPSSGHLQLDVTVQVLAGVEGVLRVSIGNSRRAELLLRPGEAGRSLKIDLTTEDLTRERLVVSFSLQGESPLTPCGKDEGLEAIVEIETTSALFLALDADELSVRDRANLAGRQVTLNWSKDPKERAEALRAAHILSDASWKVHFGSGSDTILPATAISGLPSGSASQKPKYAWSGALAATSTIYGLRRFKNTHSWRIRYDLMDSEEPNVPATFTLDIFLGTTPLEAAWNLSVTHNNRLVDHVTLSQGATYLTRKIDLSKARQARENVIEIVAWSQVGTSETCTEGPDLLAEITDHTSLSASAETFSSPLLFLRRAFAQAEGWHLEVDKGLTAPEATVAVTLLSNLLSNAAQKPKSAKGISVHALPRGASLARWSGSTGDTVWLVSFDENGIAFAQMLPDYPVSETRAVTVLVDLTEVAT
ncbi:MAG: hypothetical protein ACU0BK_10865 [Shimia sp.]|uniref:hypothetical protein n=1 Tax=Shimia sp. TaxID=1954381 RepID=UPI004058D53E